MVYSTVGTHGVFVRPLMLGAIGAVGEGLWASGKLAVVRPLPSVRPEMNLQVLSPRKRLVAAFVL